MCGHSRVNLEKSQNPDDEMGAFWVDGFCFGDRPVPAKKRRRRRAAVYSKAGTQTGTDQDRYYTALPAHVPLLGGIGRRTDHGDDGGPPGGGGGSHGLTAAMLCWLLLAAARQLLPLGTTVGQQQWIEL